MGFVRPRDRAQFIASRALLRRALASYGATAPDGWVLGVNAVGRAVVEAPAPWRALRFSVSHADGLVACAFAWDRELGVDVERATRPVDVERLTRRFFPPAERARILSAPADQRSGRFWRQWTLKEAYVKALGLGLARSFSSFSIEPDRSGYRVAPREDGGAWHFLSARVAGTHWLACCMGGGRARPRLVLREPPTRSALEPVAVELASPGDS